MAKDRCKACKLLLHICVIQSTLSQVRKGTVGLIQAMEARIGIFGGNVLLWAR
jgi:hypothetical protein